jgi:hypothetical protein
MYCQVASSFDDSVMLGVAITKSQPDENHLAIVYHDGVANFKYRLALAKANLINDLFEQSFFIMVHLPYL